MAVSSSSLFHYTSGDYDVLLSILTSGFRISRCDETHTDSNGLDTLHLYVPMVCFCDIPLSLIEKHTKLYCYQQGSKVFGIGMNKKWGIDYGFNPIIYLNQQSHLSRVFDTIEEITSQDLRIRPDLIDVLNQFRGQESENQLFKKIESVLRKYPDVFINSARIGLKALVGQFEDGNTIEIETTMSKSSLFIKPYMGDYERNGNIIKDYIFYNEREWRFIPQIKSAFGYFDPIDDDIKTYIRRTVNPLFTDNEVLDYVKSLFESKKNAIINPLSSHLNFNSEDISIIIVNDKEDVNRLTDYFLSDQFERLGGIPIHFEGELKRNRYSLISKIISYQQIQDDLVSH